MRARLGGVVAALALLAASGCGGDETSAGPEGTLGISEPAPRDGSDEVSADELEPPSSDVVAPSALDSAAPLPQRAGANGVAGRVEAGLAPPTNRWYSGLVFGQGPASAYASPLSITSRDGGLSIGVPSVSVTETAIIGPAVHDVAMAVEGATGLPRAVEAGPVHAVLGLGGATGELARVTMAAGWPAVSVEARADTALVLDIALTSVGQGVWAAEVDGRRYAVVVDGDDVDPGGGDGGGDGGGVAGSRIRLPAGATVIVIAVPDGADLVEMARQVGGAIDGVDVGLAVREHEVLTSLAYRGGDGTVVALDPSRAEGLDCKLGEWETIQGPLRACATSSVTWPVPAVEPTTTHELDAIAGEERAAVVAALRESAEATPEFLDDTYFGAKVLHRQAVQVSVAASLGEEALAAELAAPLIDELLVWTQADGCDVRDRRCFQYDVDGRGVVGLQPAFGSELYNDHHFHYGYLLNAAAIAARHDPGIIDQIAPVMDLVAADIASPPGSTLFPELRVFDPYAGHSWASGHAPFADGNNQESSSEAVLAWNGVAAWAQVRDDPALETTARWMLALEADAARRLWLHPDLSAWPRYEHDMVSLSWGARREHTTWFSQDPSAILGIQLIPMAPVQTHLRPADADQSAAIGSLVEESGGIAAGAPLNDYVLMYSALAGEWERQAAWEAALAMPAAAIDGGNSRAALLAWIAAAGSGG
ncbi:glycosyl hydrolase [Demequina sp. NBRC 110053]|uniref:glycosyl hydrolase n=1 Tax=Demequina sp. NBRC 110053 TaxID=1570342 RepID=UPI000A06A59C|nr:glycosyl hydrolase [Demequina sp. NBRC 110053]